MSYLPIRLKTLMSGVTLGFDLHIKIDQKMLLLVHDDDSIEQDRIKSLEGKNVRKLYILDHQEQNYQDYVDKCLNLLVQDENVSIDEKSEMVVSAAESTAERIYDDPHSQKSYQAAQNTTNNLISVLSKSDELLKGIFDKKLDQNNDSLESRMQKHSVNSASLTISFAESLQVGSSDVESLGVAALFHDIAFGQMEESAKKLFIKDLSKMEANELTVYKTHPKIGAEILQDKDFASKEIINLILGHEERRNGAGFPNKLQKIDDLQEILNICCYYDQRVTCYGEERDAVLEHLTVDQIGNFDLDLIKKFKSFVKKAGL